MKTQIANALKAFLLLTVITGTLYPLFISLVAQIFFAHQANGSLIFKNKQIVGSQLIGQSFKSTRYFWPRPSATDYNPLPSGGSNLGPTSSKLKQLFDERSGQGFALEMRFASASGLDPHISPEAARAQVPRIANARNGVNQERIMELIKKHIEMPDFGVLGEERVNVLQLNLALDKEDGRNE